MSQYTKYRLYKYQRRARGSSDAWQDVLPMYLSYNGNNTMEPVIVEQNSADCGYIPTPDPQYRWVNIAITSDYDCDATTYTKYYKQKRQVSRDNGATWQDVSPAQYQRGAVYETDSVDCGYGQLYKVTLRKSDGTTKTVLCNGNTKLRATEVEEPSSSKRSLITSADIGSCVTRMEQEYCGVFQHCSSLTSITIPNSVIEIGVSAFQYCTSLTSVTIPNSVVTIYEYAFAGCGLTSIVIPDSVTKIRNDAFNGCPNLTNVTIGSGVTDIGNYTFANCPSLTTLTVLRTLPPDLAFTSFNKSNKLSAIYVPAESVNAYKWGYGWSEYADIIQAI